MNTVLIPPVPAAMVRGFGYPQGAAKRYCR